jgi:hypothetical protein
MHGDGKATVLRSSKFLTSYEESMRTAKHAPKVGLDDKGKGKILDGLQSRDNDGRSQQEAASIPEVAAECGDIEASTVGAKWMVVDDMVLHKGRIFMPSSSVTWPLVLEQAHGMGHKGMRKTLNRLCASFYTPHTTKLVQEFI